MLLLLLWTPLPWGSNNDAQTAIAGIGFSALLLAWLLLHALRKIAPAIRWSGLVWSSLALWGLWLGWILLQLQSLPPDLLEQYSPAAAKLHSAADAVVAYASHASLTIDRGRTLAQLILSGSYFALYLLVLLVVNSRQRITLFLWALTLSGLFQAFYGMHMTLSGVEYGFFEKKQYGAGVATGTFVNRNHYAAYLELALAAGIGIVLSEIGRWRTQTWKEMLADAINLLLSAKFRARIILIVMVAALILTRSRMGNIAFFVALSSCGILFTLLRYRQWFVPSLLLFSSLLLVDLWVVSRWFGLEEVVERIESTELQTEGRSLLLEDLHPLIRDYQVTGSGLGTFAVAYAPHRNEQIRGYFDHAHNEYVQFLIETGFVGCLILGLLLLVHVLQCLRVMVRRKTPIYSGAAFTCLMAITAMMVHASAEFMLRLPGVTFTFVALLALGMGVSSESRARKRTDVDAGIDESASLTTATTGTST